jgi:hypothetical protein
MAPLSPYQASQDQDLWGARWETASVVLDGSIQFLEMAPIHPRLRESSRLSALTASTSNLDTEAKAECSQLQKELLSWRLRD